LQFAGGRGIVPRRIAQDWQAAQRDATARTARVPALPEDGPSTVLRELLSAAGVDETRWNWRGKYLAPYHNSVTLREAIPAMADAAWEF